MSNKNQSAQAKIDLDSLEIDMLSINVTQDFSGVLNVHVNCNDHEFDGDLLSELIEKVLEMASGVVEPVTLH